MNPGSSSGAGPKGQRGGRIIRPGVWCLLHTRQPDAVFGQLLCRARTADVEQPEPVAPLAQLLRPPDAQDTALFAAQAAGRIHADEHGCEAALG